MADQNPAAAQQQNPKNPLCPTCRKPLREHPTQAGPLRGYYGDLSSGDIVPENMRVEDLTYQVTIDPAGQITAFSATIQIVSQYNFALRRIIGWQQNPQLMGAAPSLVKFNVKDEGRAFEVFKRPVSMASISAVGGAGNIAEFDGVFIMIPGAQVAVDWSVDVANWAALVGTTKTMGVQLVGDYVICRTTG